MSYKKLNMIPTMYINLKKSIGLMLLACIALSSCKKIFDLPDEKDYLSSRINYNNKTFDPILGRNNIMGGFNGDNSTQPIKFEIINARFGDGRPVTDLFQVRPTYVWTKAYTGLEKSIEEIEAKRKLEDHPLFEVRQSGEFILWAAATNDLITPRAADTTNFPQNTRYFDLRVTNSGGSAIIRDLSVRPFRERPYEPSDDFNIYSGGPAPHPKSPNNPNSRNYIRPFLNNVIGAQSDQPLRSNDDYKEVVVYIRPVPGGSGNSIRFKFLDKDSVAINPNLFNETRWDRIVHGFNMEKTNEYVQYTVAYPIPLVEVVTNYAPGGNRDHAEFSYSRKGFGGGRTVATFGIDFAIYKKGDWEVVFHFLKENPKFEDE
ncbi:DUF5007 domain-containing protein [Mucilaginibacter defluvii]|uniref:DUF5007 domain-containing protein n=1 Tax=Mucilaginibacter defluvii TaxID=1196019 RepID=A0ABP9FUC5_9SPHI